MYIYTQISTISLEGCPAFAWTTRTDMGNQTSVAGFRSARSRPGRVAPEEPRKVSLIPLVGEDGSIIKTKML